MTMYVFVELQNISLSLISEKVTALRITGETNSEDVSYYFFLNTHLCSFVFKAPIQ